MNCIDCKNNFTPNPKDYLPSQRCPDCRMKLLLSFRNERKLYKQQCDLCKKDFIGTYRPSSPYTVYCAKCWWSDKWDAKDYALSYDASKSFTDQFKTLYMTVPHLGMNVTNSVNSDFTNYADKNKDCYLVINASDNENVFYSERVFNSKDSLECNGVTNGQLNYWNLSCRDCYNTKFSEYCSSLVDCWFMANSSGCDNCFGSFGVKQGEYIFLNKQLTPAEYEQKVNALQLHTINGLNQAKQLVYEHWLQYPHRYTNATLSENVTGDNVTRSKNCQNIFDADDMENCHYCYAGIGAKDSQYCAPADAAEHCANCMSTWKSYNTYCSIACWYGSDIWYSAFCMSGQNLFGCVGLNKAKYSILNKEYTTAEYNKLTQHIVQELKRQNIFGEFFDPSWSPFPYEDTVIPRYTDNCVHPFKIIKPEQALYQQLGVPEPTQCPNCRYSERMQRRNPRILVQRQCRYQKCGTLVQSSYLAERPEIIYCEEHYVKHYN